MIDPKYSAYIPYGFAIFSLAYVIYNAEKSRNEFIKATSSLEDNLKNHIKEMEENDLAHNERYNILKDTLQRVRKLEARRMLSQKEEIFEIGRICRQHGVL